MSEKRVLIINPNSNQSVTDGLAAAVAEDALPGTLALDCVTLAEAPFGIETDDDIEAVIPLIMARISAVSDDYDAFVIACYSDPGLIEARDLTAKPVLGIQESAVSLAASYGRRFGVLALGRESIQRHIAYVRELGMQSFHAGERPLGISVDDAVNDPGTLGRIIETGRELIDEDRAELLILGCAGMSIHRKAAQTALGVPVIDPVQAAVTMVRHDL
jgi:allantoin racemase